MVQEQRPSIKSPSADRLDRGMTIIVALLLVAVVGFAGYFTWRIVEDRRTAQNADTNYRITKTLEKQVKASPDNSTLRVRLGEAFVSAGKYKEGIKQFQEAIKLKKDHTGAYNDMGMAFLYMEQPADAEKAFTKVIELTEGSEYKNLIDTRESAFYALGRIKLTAKEYEKAAGYFKEALRIRRDASDSYVALSLCLMGLKDYDGAIEQANMALQFDPKNAEANFIMGEAYMAKGDKSTAIFYYATAAKAEPDRVEIQDALKPFGTSQQHWDAAKAAQAKGDFALARDEIIIATNLDTENVEIMVDHIAIAKELKRYSEAYDVAKKAALLKPEDAQIKSLVKELKPLAAKDSKGDAK